MNSLIASGELWTRMRRISEYSKRQWARGHRRSLYTYKAAPAWPPATNLSSMAGCQKASMITLAIGHEARRCPIAKAQLSSSLAERRLSGCALHAARVNSIESLRALDIQAHFAHRLADNAWMRRVRVRLTRGLYALQVSESSSKERARTQNWHYMEFICWPAQHRNKSAFLK